MLASPDIEVSKDDAIQDLQTSQDLLTGRQAYSKRGPQVIAEDKFRFEVFALLIEEWLGRNLRRNLRIRTAVKCLI
ncbi:hypothetical protein RSJ42_09610 [Methanosarcina hadiensis]|uniref:hypothetical protein n=1 Tax=Methanosarcina hadiensis TaxID=3078083 RepID=UPI003977E365